MSKEVIEFIPSNYVSKGQILIKSTVYHNIPYEVTDEFTRIVEENQQLKEVIEEAKENINELIEHYKRLLNAKFNQEISVFVDNTHKNMFISNVISSLEVMKIYILDKVGDQNTCNKNI